MSKKIKKSYIVLIISIIGIFIILPLLNALENSFEESKNQSEKELISISKDIKTRKDDIKFASKNIKEFSEIEIKGTLLPHKRISALTKLDELRRHNYINKMSWEFTPQQEITNNIPNLRIYNLSSSKIKLNISAIIDVDIFNFIKELETVFPGFVSVEHLEIKRTKVPLASALTAIASGNKPDLLEAEININWLTVPDKNVFVR